MFMRKVQFYHGDPVRYPDKSGLKAIGTRWVHTSKGDAANPFIRARLVAQETKTVSEVTPEDASSTFVAALPVESSKMMLSRCVTGKLRVPAEEMYDISKTNFQSLACRTIVIKVPREGRRVHEWVCKFWMMPMFGTKDAAQCFDVASENAMTAMEYDTCLYHSSAVDKSVFRHGDDFVASGTRTQQKEFEEHLSKYLIVKHLPILGPCTALGDVTEVRKLNRIVRC